MKEKQMSFQKYQITFFGASAHYLEINLGCRHAIGKKYSVENHC